MKRRAARPILFRIAVYCALFLVMLESAGAATLRVHLNRLNHGRAVPAADVCITVFASNGARSPRACSNSRGIYYLPNILPGNYVLEIWTNPGAPPIRQNIRVAEPYTDIQPITVR